MKVLVACERSQVVTEEFRNLGVSAWSCDISPCYGNHPEWHFQCDALELINQKWDIIIAHPPCTFMSKAGAQLMFPNGKVDKIRLSKAMGARDFFMKFYNNENTYIAIENPRPLNIVCLPPATQVIQPYEYGDPYTKKTYLWLKGLPFLLPTGYVKPIGSWTNIKKSSKDRSQTFRGIARAMAEQWTEFYQKQK